MGRKIVIDCDTGVDDAQAIALALAEKQTEVLAITCVAGNVGASQAAANTVRVLHAAGRTDIPVFIGAQKPLLSIPYVETAHTDPTKYHGIDGMGDAPHATTSEPEVNPIKKGIPAAMKLVELAREHPGEITLVALGPLTNIALALKLDDDFGGNLKEVYLMGGAIHAKGNVTITGEFNVVEDPEAANIVLEDTACPVHIMSWETSSQGGLDWEWHDKWLSGDSTVKSFLREISKHTCHQDRVTWNTLYCPPDVVTMAWALRPQLAKEVRKEIYCTVETGRSILTRGMMIVDWRNLLNKPKKNICICLSWDKAIFQEILEIIE